VINCINFYREPRKLKIIKIAGTCTKNRGQGTLQEDKPFPPRRQQEERQTQIKVFNSLLKDFKTQGDSTVEGGTR
jgi:hypothetical protein